MGSMSLRVKFVSTLRWMISLRQLRSNWKTLPAGLPDDFKGMATPFYLSAARAVISRNSGLAARKLPTGILKCLWIYFSRSGSIQSVHDLVSGQDHNPTKHQALLG